MDIEGKVALVTGGGRGLGRATSLALAERGARVVAAARSLSQVEETALLIRQQYGFGRSMAVRADVTHEEQVAALFEKIRQRWGGVDILVNNAGETGATRPVASLTLAEWQHALDANLTSVFLCSREALRDMAQRRWGRIINLSSDSTKRAVPGLAAYSVSKAAVEHLTKVIAAEGAPFGVAAVALRPGVVDTRMQAEMRSRPLDAIPPELRAIYAAYKRNKMLVPPELPARMIAYLCTAQASEINGRVLDAGEMESILAG